MMHPWSQTSIFVSYTVHHEQHVLETTTSTVSFVYISLVLHQVIEVDPVMDCSVVRLSLVPQIESNYHRPSPVHSHTWLWSHMFYLVQVIQHWSTWITILRRSVTKTRDELWMCRVFVRFVGEAQLFVLLRGHPCILFRPCFSLWVQQRWFDHRFVQWMNRQQHFPTSDREKEDDG